MRRFHATPLPLRSVVKNDLGFYVLASSRVASLIAYGCGVAFFSPAPLFY